MKFPETGAELVALLDRHSGVAGWLQAIVAGLAILAVYWAATIPVRAEVRRLERERRLRADGLALLLVSEVAVLKGEIETQIEFGDLYRPPIVVSPTLAGKTDDLYLMGEPGRRLLQAIGLVNGVAAQTRRFQALGIRDGVPVESMRANGNHIWAGNVSSLHLALVDLNEALDMMPSLQTS
jgi:hypothetical protein